MGTERTLTWRLVFDEEAEIGDVLLPVFEYSTAVTMAMAEIQVLRYTLNIGLSQRINLQHQPVAA